MVLGAGFFTLFAPWWLRTLRELTSERRERVRAQERADMAAHLHDSVLQTLSLIQRSAHDPVEVARLARIQERDLRSWLFRPAAFWTRAEAPSTLAEAAADIERGRRVEQLTTPASPWPSSSSSATARSTSRYRHCAGSRPRRPRSMLRNGREPRASRCSSRWRPKSCRCSFEISGSASSCRASRRTAMASLVRSSSVCSESVATGRSGARSVPSTEVQPTCFPANTAQP